MDAREEIKRLYFNATPKTIDRDLARAIELLKTLPDEEARERLAVYMDGLSTMRAEARGGGERREGKPRPKGGPKTGARGGANAGPKGGATAGPNASAKTGPNPGPNPASRRGR